MCRPRAPSAFRRGTCSVYRCNPSTNGNYASFKIIVSYEQRTEFEGVEWSVDVRVDFRFVKSPNGEQCYNSDTYVEKVDRREPRKQKWWSQDHMTLLRDVSHLILMTVMASHSYGVLPCVGISWSTATCVIMCSQPS